MQMPPLCRKILDCIHIYIDEWVALWKSMHPCGNAGMRHDDSRMAKRHGAQEAQAVFMSQLLNCAIPEAFLCASIQHGTNSMLLDALLSLTHGPLRHCCYKDSEQAAVPESSIKNSPHKSHVAYHIQRADTGFILITLWRLQLKIGFKPADYLSSTFERQMRFPPFTTSNFPRAWLHLAIRLDNPATCRLGSKPEASAPRISTCEVGCLAK